MDAQPQPRPLSQAQRRRLVLLRGALSLPFPISGQRPSVEREAAERALLEAGEPLAAATVAAASAAAPAVGCHRELRLDRVASAAAPAVGCHRELRLLWPLRTQGSSLPKFHSIASGAKNSEN